MLKALIVFETRSGVTRSIAEAVQAGLKEGGVKVVLKNTADVDLAELAKVQSVILGSPTYHKDMLQNMKTFLFKLEQANLKGKIGAAFGAYGWSGESVGMIYETMLHIYGMEMVDPGVKLPGTASPANLERFKQFGNTIAAKIKEPVK
jgi:flavorubredoxin